MTWTGIVNNLRGYGKALLIIFLSAIMLAWSGFTWKGLYTDPTGNVDAIGEDTASRKGTGAGISSQIAYIDGTGHAAPAPALSDQDCRQIDVRVKKGQTLSDILSGLGVKKGDIAALAGSGKHIYDLSRIRTGNNLSVWLRNDDPSRVSMLSYEISDVRVMDVFESRGSYTARLRSFKRDVSYCVSQGTIRGSLYESATAEGLDPEIVMNLTEIFAHDVNFFSDIKDGDTYNVLYEKFSVKGRFTGCGRIMAASFTNQGREHLAVFYENRAAGIKGYYTPEGTPLKKVFLKAPLNYRRISSLFSRHRRHPITGIVSPHLGVDYAAPTGTPVCSLGSGKIVFRGWVSGFGWTVRVSHPGGYETSYGHLSRFARGMTRGKRVDQGDTIGYVGSTGHATGPHLDFRVKLGNRYINPLKMKNVAAPPLSGESLADFRKASPAWISMLEDRDLNIAMEAPSRSVSLDGASPRG